MNSTHILWNAAGRPPGEGDTPGLCRVCGLDGTGLSFRQWVRDTFTDHDKLLPGDILCQPCQFSFAEASELLRQRTGKEKLQRMRNYSHFVVDGAWRVLSKGDKAGMRDILLAGQYELAVIAESGQKHLIFQARPGLVQFELQRVEHLDAALLADIEALYTGFSKEEIQTGRYAQHRIVKFGLPMWQALEAAIKSRRNEAGFALALFLAQREEKEGDDRATATGRQPAGGHLAGSAGGLQEPVSDEHLAAVRGPDPQRRVHKQPGQVRQLALFETGRDGGPQ